MKVPTGWLDELVELSVPIKEVVRLLPLRTIGTKEVTDEFIELDMKGYNRPDLLSIRGVAYEVAAITDSKVTFREKSPEEYIWVESVEKDGRKWTIKPQLTEVKAIVQNEKLVPIYCLAEIEGLSVGKSSSEWVKKLENSGMRSVNNIADITNLVMLEYGQPLHAFDAQKVKDQTIIVRNAEEGEKLVTLDGKTRLLFAQDLVIADPEKALGLAGVMGGENSEVTKDTTTILLEAAVFDPLTLRATAQRHNLRSEASKRFQHGLTSKRLLQALDQAIRMYEGLGGKFTGITLIITDYDKEHNVPLGLNKTNQLIGVNLSSEDITKYLQKLCFSFATYKKSGDDYNWIVVPPYYRRDINIEEDLIEEVARMYGYARVAAQKPPGQTTIKTEDQLFHRLYNKKAILARLGMTEVQTYSYYSTLILNNLGINRSKLIRVTNPMSKETEYLRDELWPSLLQVSAENLKTRDDLAIFEIGKSYHPKKNSLPEEKYLLAAALSSNTTVSIQEIFIIFQKMMDDLGLEYGIKEVEMNDMEKELFHPTRFAKITYDAKEIGFIGEVHPRITYRFGTEKRIAVLQLDLEPFLKG